MNFDKRKALVAHCTKPDGPMLYRTLYKMFDTNPPFSITTEKEWTRLPFLTKDSLIETPFRERVFNPGYEVDHLRGSSGTSGKPPLFSPRTYLRHMEYRFDYYDFRGAMLAFTVPAMPHWHEYFQGSAGIKPRVIAFDPKQPAASVRLAKLARVEAISCFAFMIPLIGEHMLREGCNDKIKFIEICGEGCSRTLFDYVRATFPHATLIPFYGSSEVEDSPIGVPCRAITGEEPLAVYHRKPSQYHELVEPETDSVIEPQKGAEGELVVSAYPGEPSACPLIRYKTGDMVRVVEEKCAHGMWTFTVLGRAQLDFMKIPGGLLRADEAERVVRKMAERITDRFQVHRYELPTEKGPKIQLEFHVETKGNIDLGILALDIAELLRINPSLTYGAAVAHGRFLPLICKPLDTAALAGKKLKRLVEH